MERIIENVDEDTLDILTPKYEFFFFSENAMQIFFTNIFFSRRLLKKHVNTYGFTKGLVEQLVYDYSKKFPTVVARPPISKCEIRKINNFQYFFRNKIPSII